MKDIKESTGYQQNVWDSIADLWHQYRQRPMKEVLEFLRLFENNKNAKILDLCCGSGRHFIKIDGKLYGVDFSEKMLEYAEHDAKKKGINVVLRKAYAHQLPFDDDCFDAVVFTAGLHSIETRYRKKVLLEIKRVLKPNGRLLITVWNKNNKSGAKEDFVPWKKDGKEYLRYYYLFTKDELRGLVEKSGLHVDNVELSENKAFKMFPKNIVLLAHKPKP